MSGYSDETLWAKYAAAALTGNGHLSSSDDTIERAVDEADRMLAEHRKRYPLSLGQRLKIYTSTDLKAIVRATEEQRDEALKEVERLKKVVKLAQAELREVEEAEIPF